MKLVSILLASLLCLLPCSQALAVNASESPDMKPLPVGAAAPDLTLPAPAAAKEAAELGLPASATTFRLADLKADAVVLVVFSMYCTYCQKEAPSLAKLHALIRERGLSGKLKLIGLGAGNSAYEVNVFRETYKLSLPLVEDPDYAAHKALGQVGTPFYYVLARQGQGFVIVDEQLGRVDSMEQFLKAVQDKTGLSGRK